MIMTAKHVNIDNISRKALIEFFRQKILTDWGYKEVKHADDKSVLTEFTGPHDYPGDGYIDFRFLTSKVFGEDICSKIGEYTLELTDERGVYGARNKIFKKGDATSLKLFDEYVRFFNSDIVYRHFDEYEDEGPNLFVLEKQSLTNNQKAELIERGESWLKVLYGLQNEMKTYHGWGWHLSKGLEHVIAKVGPETDKDFIHSGKVLGFAEGGDWMEYPGCMEVSSSVQPDFNIVVLIDGFKPKEFGHLIGQEVRFHYIDLKEYVDENAYSQCVPYGKLVSVPNKA